MPISDFFIVVRWWGTLFLFGAAAFPLTSALFEKWPASNASRSDAGWHDRGYLFSKAVGMAAVSWLVFVLGMARIAPFTEITVVGAIASVFALGVFLPRLPKSPRSPIWKTMLAEELFFFLALLFWSWVKAHEPSIRGLEKFMDFGFMNSILHSRYFPPADMWYPPYPVNYYYFGHLVTAVLTKLSGIDLGYTFNLMLATIFALCFTMSYSIGKQLIRGGGLLTAFLVTFAGNMQTIYAFTKGYSGENVQAFWKLGWLFPGGLQSYWYANATRFIPYTIHEFPSYSFVVSDVHGHVLSIPFVLLAIGLLVTMFGQKGDKGIWGNWGVYPFYGFLCGVLLMTNALDGPIYVGLFLVLLLTLWGGKGDWGDKGKIVGIVILSAIGTSLPFLTHFTSFVNGVAWNCPPSFLANSHIGPFLFESIEKCQRSPFWMMILLWGFFWYCGIALLLRKKFTPIKSGFTQIEKVLVAWFFFSILLIIFPEFFYFKDIYPQHFRSNTMFKLGYEAFILWSIVSGYTIVKLIRNKLFLLLLLPQLFLISIYPYFSVRSYFSELKTYDGIWGLGWLAREYPDNYKAMQWLNKQTPGAIIEADGDSYTDYEQFSVFTGRSTVVGWAVHEWLWRGTYDVVSPRREEVRNVYESADVAETTAILEKYNVLYIIVGTLERQKFTNINEQKLMAAGEEVFRSGETVIIRR